MQCRERAAWRYLKDRPVALGSTEVCGPIEVPIDAMHRDRVTILTVRAAGFRAKAVERLQCSRSVPDVVT